MVRSGVYGWYGKVPHLGDFTTSGLSHGFVKAWDAWLQNAIVTGRTALGGRWQDSYMTAPIWRFACAAGVLGDKAAAGVLMPSVDRVGRHFPLCLAVEASSEEWPGCWPAYCALSPVFADLEAIALLMLEDGATTEHLSASLAGLPHPDVPSFPAADHCGPGTFQSSQRPVSEILAQEGLRGTSSLWVACVSGEHRVLTTSLLPETPSEITALFDVNAPCWSAGGTRPRVPA